MSIISPPAALSVDEGVATRRLGPAHHSYGLTYHPCHYSTYAIRYLVEMRHAAWVQEFVRYFLLGNDDSTIFSSDPNGGHASLVNGFEGIF